MAYASAEKMQEAEKQMKAEMDGVHEYGDFIIRKQDSYGMFRIEAKDEGTKVPKVLLGLWTDLFTAQRAIDSVTENQTKE
jgi:hypothetical protein